MTASLLLLLKQAERRIEHQLRPILADFDLSLEQWRVMSALADEPGQPMSTLAIQAVLPNASLTRHVDKLVERGLVVRRIHADDRRRVVTALSPVGTTVAERLRAEELRIESTIPLTELFQMEIQDLSESETPV
ncbi:MarR family transcriptional regulator [Kribbella sp. NPDC051718]|uniref:MarR family winged helix-turn-helix transcriptional regulator n=1 Tax=Kribbella sp. NPDC051718 TaxID=3155168 RepID=UPI00343F995A